MEILVYHIVLKPATTIRLVKDGAAAQPSKPTAPTPAKALIEETKGPTAPIEETQGTTAPTEETKEPTALIGETKQRNEEGVFPQSDGSFVCYFDVDGKENQISQIFPTESN